MTFWLLAGAMILVGAAFAVRPLWRPRRVSDESQRQPPASVMQAVYRDRVAELDAETRVGQIDPDTRVAVEEELGASLLDDFRAAQDKVAPVRAGVRPGPAPWLTGLLALALVGGALLVYLSAGEPTAPQVAGASEVLQLDPDTQRDALVRWRDRLEQRTAARSEDAQSWYLLGVTRLQLGEFTASAAAFERAAAQVGNDPNIDLYWLQARYLAADGRMDEQARSIAERLLAARPGHPLVLEMLAIDAYRSGDFRAAVEHLNRALNNALAPAQLQALLAGLAQARSRLGDLTPSVDVAVSAPDAAPREGTVFVIARPPGGGMPFAVVRRPAGLLPLSVRLDDTVSMSQDLTLSAAGQFEIVVRLSRNGTPAAAPGDWEWRSPTLSVADLASPLKLDADLAPLDG
jgi:cytochrome c-type biogenesis protein CcmH